jgi:peptidyl-tRNA hydrolase, PTH1 family
VQVVCGLGNPGLRYRNTWHNLGFMLLDRLAGEASFRSGRGSWLECRLELAGRDTLLVKPTTYMNLSGQALQEASQFYKVAPADLLVCFDDLDLPLGEIRLRAFGSGGNHNGMSHAVHVLGPELPRLRMGFRPPHPPQSAAWKSFVLAPIPSGLQPEIGEMLAAAAEAVGFWLREGIVEAMNRCNRGARAGGAPSSEGKPPKDPREGTP